MANEYDVIVIGAGTGGYVAAIRAAQLGLEDRRRRKAEGARRDAACCGAASRPRRCSSTRTRSKVVQHAKEWGVTIGAAGEPAGRRHRHERRCTTRKDRDRRRA